MSDKIIIAGRLNVKGWHNKACEILSTGGVSTCIHCQSNNLLQKIIIESDMEKEKKQMELPAELKGKKFRIRKLTPTECLRLMGCDEPTIQKMTSCGLSNSALYKLAGNSIVVDVLFHLFRKMFIETDREKESFEPTQLELF